MVIISLPEIYPLPGQCVLIGFPSLLSLNLIRRMATPGSTSAVTNQMAPVAHQLIMTVVPIYSVPGVTTHLTSYVGQMPVIPAQIISTTPVSTIPSAAFGFMPPASVDAVTSTVVSTPTMSASEIPAAHPLTLQSDSPVPPWTYLKGVQSISPPSSPLTLNTPTLPDMPPMD